MRHYTFVEVPAPGGGTEISRSVGERSDRKPPVIVEVPELPGCMADGATYEEAVANAQTVVQEWIDTAQSLGRPIPEPRGKLAYA